jgi:four helix bundle protein
MTGRFKGDLPKRTFEFAKSILNLVDCLPSNAKGWAIAKQLVRCGTSIGANISEASEALTDAEFTHRCSIARKEASETRFWLELCRGKALIQSPKLEPSIQEVDQFLRILGTMIRKLQRPPTPTQEGQLTC